MPLCPDDEVESLKRAIDRVLDDAALFQIRMLDSGYGYEDSLEWCASTLPKLRAKLLEAEIKADEALERRRVYR